MAGNRAICSLLIVRGSKIGSSLKSISTHPNIATHMKTLLLSFTSLALILSLSNCEHERSHERHHHDRYDHDRSSTTTMTEETTLIRPSATVETQTTRSYRQ